MTDRPNARVKAYAHVNSSESAEKVRQAILNILGDCASSVETGSDIVSVRADDSACLQVIHDQLRDRGVRTAARRLLLLGTSGNKVSFMVNRQAAYAGVVALCSSEEESALGPINIEISADQPEALLDWLTTIQPTG